MGFGKKIGIIDIGSNSIRLAIYEYTKDLAYRVIDGSKVSARLSELINEKNVLPLKHIPMLAEILRHFKMLCEAHKTAKIRAVATAAIRSAANCNDIIQAVQEKTDIKIEVLSGQEEAQYGYLGVINTVDIKDSFLIDIGGGSTQFAAGPRIDRKNLFAFRCGEYGKTIQQRRYGFL